jgi:serine/threonine protein phosphatase PrpC
MAFRIAEKSILGTRDEQQDGSFVHCAENRAFAVVCDGMGGLGYGSAASAVAVARLKELYAEKTSTEAWPVFFLRAVDILDECVAALRDARGEKCNAGTTLVAAAIEDNALTWLSVGDSRLYILRGGEIVRATRDHNYFLMAQTTDRRKGEVLISFIGMGGVELMDINETPFRLLPGDILLLTTDGLTKALSDNDILTILSGQPLAQALDILIEQATKQATRFQDNTTCVAIQYV